MFAYKLSQQELKEFLTATHYVPGKTPPGFTVAPGEVVPGPKLLPPQYEKALLAKLKYNPEEFHSRISFSHEQDMKKYDLSSLAIKIIVEAIIKNELPIIKCCFAYLNTQQALGMLSLIIDPNDLCMSLYSFNAFNFWNDFSFKAPMGTPAKLAESYGHTEMAKFLTDLQSTLSKAQEVDKKIEEPVKNEATPKI